jgi:hypothetical protein
MLAFAASAFNVASKAAGTRGLGGARALRADRGSMRARSARAAAAVLDEKVDVKENGRKPVMILVVIAMGGGQLCCADCSRGAAAGRKRGRWLRNRTQRAHAAGLTSRAGAISSSFPPSSSSARSRSYWL